MASLLLAASAGAAPAVLLLWLVRALVGRGRAWPPLLRLYLFSFLTIIPAAVGEGVLVLASLALDLSLAWKVALAAPAIGLTEEGVKLLFLRGLTNGRRRIATVSDGLLYGATVSLGFATIENVLYVIGGLQQGVAAQLAILRALFAVPGHASWGVLMGLYAARARLEPLEGRTRQWWAAFLVPALWHATYDLFILAAAARQVVDGLTALLFLGALAALVGAVALAVRALGSARSDQRQVPMPAPMPAAPRSRDGGFVPGAAPPLPAVPPLRAPPGGGFCVQCGGRASGTDVVCRRCSAAWSPPVR